jgi:hypothetical protein
MLTADKPAVERTVKVGADGLFRQTIPFRINDVALVRLERVSP